MAITSQGLPQAGRADPVRAIDDIKRLVVEQLGSVPGAVYAAVEQALRLSVALAPIDSNHNPYEDQAALWVLRQHHATHVMAYRQQLAEALDAKRVPARDGPEGAPLQLLSEGELETRLAAQRAAEPLQNTNKVALEALDARFAALARCVGRGERDSNPLAPLCLAQAFMAIFSDEQVPATLREQLLKQYEVALVPLLPDLYARVHALLAEHGFGDGLRRAPVARPTPTAPAPFIPDFDQVPMRTAAPEPPPTTGFETGAFHGFEHSPDAHAAPAGQGGWNATPATPGRDSHVPSDPRHAPSAAPAAGYGQPGSMPQSPSQGRFASHAGADIDPVTAQEIDELRGLLHVWRQSAAHLPPTAQRGPGQTPPSPQAAHAPSPSHTHTHTHTHSQAQAQAQAQAQGYGAYVQPSRELSAHELMGVASLLQAGPVDSFARALIGSGRLAQTIRSELRDGSRRLGLIPEQVRFTPVEDDSIDLVAMLFDTLFTNHRMVDRARRVYGRLVLPMVKVALHDPSLFVRGSHPARRLLDAVTEACAGNAGETTQERELLDRAAAAAKRVSADYNEDSAVFDLARSELDGLLTQQRRRIEMQEERAAKAAFGRERLQRAREQADAIVSRRLAAPPVSRDVGEFLATAWRHQLVQAFLRDSEAPAETTRLGDALVAADRAAAAGHGRELADRLIALEPALLSCLASSGHDDSAARHGVATLVRALAYPDAERDLQSVPIEDNPEDLAEARLWLADDAATAPGATAERMAGLAIGEWVQLTNRVGESITAKIAWISPLTDRRLLVNRRGVRVLAASVAQLAQLAHEARLVRVDDHAAVEDAMRQVRQRLHEGAALH